MPFVSCSFCPNEVWRKPCRLKKYAEVKCPACFNGDNKALFPDTTGEVWKEVPEYEEYLLVSDWGNVKTKTRSKTNGVTEKSKILTQKEKNNRYLEIGIRINSKKKYFLVHRLVAMTFLHRIEGLDFVNHKNCDKKDNRVENLEWCTSSQNSIHAHKNGRCSNEEKHHKAKLTKEKVLYIRQSNKNDKTLAQELGVSESTIQNVKARKTWKYFDLEELK